MSPEPEVDDTQKKLSKQVHAIGIDLGTSFTLMAMLKPGLNRPVIVMINFQRALASVVAYHANGVDVGKRALAMQKKPLVTIVKHNKYLIGKNNVDISIERRLELQPKFGCNVSYDKQDGVPKMIIENYKGKPAEIRAEIVASQILRACRESAIRECGYEDNMKLSMTVTVPARFTTQERKATKDACTIAGFEVDRVVSEPTAACFDYVYEGYTSKCKQGEEKSVLVFDFGGGTFDVSCCTINPDELIEVLCTGGDVMLGGSDVTEKLGRKLLEHFVENNEEFDLNELWKDPKVLTEVLSAAEDAKKDINTPNTDRIEVNFRIKETDFIWDLTKKDFDKLFLSAFGNQLKNITKGVMEESGKAASEYEAILLVGGSSRIHALDSIFIDLGFTLKQIFRGLNFDEAVACGAALINNSIRKHCKMEEEMPLLIDVTAMPICIRTKEDDATVLIPKSEKIPCKKSMDFTNEASGQSAVTLHISEGPFPLASMNKHMFQANMELPPNLRRGQAQVRVTFEIDADGIMHLEAQELTMSKDKGLRTKIESKSMTAEEVKEYEDRMNSEKESIAKKTALMKCKERVSDKLTEYEECCTDDHAEVHTARNNIANLRNELRGISSANILEKDEAYFNQLHDRIINDPVYKDMSSKSAAATPQAGAQMPPQPTAAPAASEPNIDEAD